MEWGAHFCHFYETKQDLLDVVIPYFKKGLENNEFCLWIVAEPLGPEEAKDAFKAACAGGEEHLASGRIEIISSESPSLSPRQQFSGSDRVDIVASTDWYLKDGVFVVERVIAGWTEKLTKALGKGFSGMRVNANESWLTTEHWKVFSAYEASLDKWLHNRRMIALCSYPLNGAGAAQILDIAHTHQFVITKRDGHWETLEAPGFLRPRPSVFLSTPVAHDIARLSDGRIVEVNPAFLKMFGYDLQEVIGHTAVELGLWANAKQRETYLEMLARHGTVQDFETQARTKSGDLLDIIAFAAPVEVAGEPCLLSTMYDVTERRQAEKAVRESQQLLGLVLETLPVGVAVMDAAGDISLINKASQRIWGGPIAPGRERYEQAKGYWHDTGQRIEPADWASARALTKGETSLNELIEIETYDGQRKIIRNSAAPVRMAEGTIVGAVFVNEDVTDRIRAEEALRRSEDELRRAIDTIPVMAWTLQPDGVVDFLNQRWMDYAGLSLEQYVADPTGPVHPEDIPRVMEKWRVQKARAEGYDEELRLRSADGEYRWFLIRTAPLYDASGKLIKWYGVSTDIEDRKRAEESLQKANQKLRGLSRRFFKVQEDEKRHLARELHDEMAQSLAAAKINLQSASRTEGHGAIAKNIQDSITIIDGLFQQVRLLSINLRSSLLDDLGLVPALRSHLDEQAQRAGFRGEFVANLALGRLAPEIETACFRVAQEAVTNIVRHAEAKNVCLELRLEAEKLHLIVRDDGRGFDVPHRIESAEQGKSLGLLGMRERVTLIGGELDIQSHLGRGTKLHAFFPINSKG
ncbi:MAG TPA: PAS domain S-box protein [Chthoniobacterales bacterium]|nr:PAS domain S-box protein [Chthoniobacterales bacterium]